MVGMAGVGCRSVAVARLTPNLGVGPTPGAGELGVELPEHGGECEHLKSGRRPWTAGGRPRAALDRTV